MFVYLFTFILTVLTFYDAKPLYLKWKHKNIHQFTELKASGGYFIRDRIYYGRLFSGRKFILVQRDIWNERFFGASRMPNLRSWILWTKPSYVPKRTKWPSLKSCPVVWKASCPVSLNNSNNNVFQFKI